MSMEQALGEYANSLSGRSTEGGSGHQGTRGFLGGSQTFDFGPKIDGVRATPPCKLPLGFRPF